MSVVGISPTDIVKTVKVVKDAATALTSGPEGARQQFQDVHAALSSRELAAAELKLSASSEDASAAVYNDLLERERRFLASLQPYGKRLGPNNKTKPWVAIKRKLQYAFDGASKVQNHIVTSKPGVDAAMFHTMREVVLRYSPPQLTNNRNRTQSDLVTKNHEETVKAMRDGIASVTERIEAVGPDTIARLSQVIMSLPQEHSDTVKAALTSHWESTKVDLPRLINQAVLAGIANSAHTEVDTSQNQVDYDDGDQVEDQQPQSAQFGDSIRQPPPDISRETSVVARRELQRSMSSISRHTQDAAAQLTQHHTSSVASRLLVFLLSISTAALYQNPTTRKALTSCLPAYHRDPVSSTLLLLTVLAFANCFISVPLHVSLLTDNSIFLDTALGEPLKVPRHYWESFDIFHGFLATHFATRPGQVYVKARRYRILLGGATGQVLDIAKWNMVISARMKLVMALLIESSRSECPKCLSPLAPRKDSLSYCVKCDSFYQSLDTDEGQGGIDGEDMDQSDDISLGPRGLSPDTESDGLAKQPLRNMGAEGLHSRFKLQAHPDELQHFVHMLLSKGVEPSLPPSSTASEAARSHKGTEDLDFLAEALAIRVNNWHGLEFERFGSLRLHGHLRVGKPEQKTQEVDCYLFEEILILAKDKRGSEWRTVSVRDREMKKCGIKGSILFKKHLTSITDPQDLVLTLNLCVEELPAINLYFHDALELETWRRGISDLAFQGSK